MQNYTYFRQKYSNNTNYCFAEYEIFKSGYIILNDYNSTYKKLFKITSNKYDYKKLTELMKPDVAQYVAQCLFHCIEIQKKHCFGWHTIHPNSPDLWECSITIKYTKESIKIYQMLQRFIDFSQRTPRLSTEFISNYDSKYTLYCNTNNIILIFKILPNEIIIENTNKKYLFDLPISKIIGKSIEEFPIFRNMKEDILTCIQTQKIKSSINSFNFNKNGECLILSFAPLFQDNITRAFVCINNITNSNLSQQSIKEEFNHYFYSSSDALCVYFVTKDKSMIIERENLPFIHIREKFEKANHPFLPKDVLKKVLDEQKPYTENLCLKQPNHKINCFTLQAEPFFEKNVVRKVLICIKPQNDELPITPPLPYLTNREQDIFKLLLDGSTNKHISFKLNISEGTVKKIIYNIYKKFNVSSRIEIIKLFSNSSSKWINN